MLDGPDNVQGAKGCVAAKEDTLLRAFKCFLVDNRHAPFIKLDAGFFDADEGQQDFELKPGTQVGNFTIESVIGSGGMSVVYRAIQKTPVKRRVAIKLIRPSLYSPKTVLRFFREQQALALAAHPNIATLYEVGKTDTGHPFAAIEFVNGLPITSFCKKHGLSSRQRILLFIQACKGLHHAHHKGIVHRDIKPDNILVAISERKPVPKLIDFGIAKIDRADLTNDQTMTRVGQIIGSPRYMSPEQFACETTDQRSDVYSAALVLFEMLARSPYRKGDTTQAILEEVKLPEAELLSRRIKSNTNKSGMIGNESSAGLIKSCKQNLDWVMAKALANAPAHRYSSVESFVKDLRAVLNNDDVSVIKPNVVVRSQSVLKSNLTSVIAGTIGILSIAAAIGIYNWNSSASKLSLAQRESDASAHQVSIAQEEFAAAVHEIEVAVEQTSAANVQTAAANDLIIRLLASDMYELTTEQFDLGLIPVYQAQYEEIRSSGGPQTKEDKTVYGILAVLHAVSGDFDSADSLMGVAADDEQRSELGLVRGKICAEYAASAKQSITELAASGKSFERASQQVTLGRCYIVLGMLGEAKGLLGEAIAFFDSDAPGCYESLVARLTLLKIHENANDSGSQNALLKETHELFKGNEQLLSTVKGRDAFEMIESRLKINLAKTSSPLSQSKEVKNEQ